MKQQLRSSLLLAMAISSVAVAQPVLTATSINPVVGDIYTLNYGNYVSPGNAGANQTWNLSAITPTTTSAYTVVTAASVPNSATFSANSNMAMSNGSAYAFLNISSGAYQNSGTRVGSTDIVYSNNEDILQFPFSMSNTFTDSWMATFPVSIYTFTRTGVTTVTYDGYGTLSLPNATLSNVARVHVVQTYTDASAFQNQYYTNDEYLWLDNNYHQPVAGITSLTIVSGPNTNTSQTGFYASPLAVVATGIQTQHHNGLRISAFPNPASDAISFTSGNELALQSIHLFDQYGKLVAVQAVDPSANAEAAVTISLEGLSAGIYMAKITAQNGKTETQKISVTR